MTTTIASQLKGLKEGKHEAARVAYIELLHTSGADELSASDLRHIVETCSEMGISIDQFDVDRKIAGGLADTQEKIDTEGHHRKQCAALSKKIANIAGVIPRHVNQWLSLPYVGDKRAEKKKREKVRQHYSELMRSQSLLRQVVISRESFKRQREESWWINDFLSLTETN